MNDFIEYLKTVDTPTLCNAIELLKVRPHEEGFTPLQVRCLFPEMGRMVGMAVTATVETVTQMKPRDNRTFVELYRAVQNAPKPSIVVLQEIGAHPDYAVHCGEVMATTFLRCGAIGLVSDAAVRDIPEVRAMKFHYFARGTAASHANFRIAQVGVPVQIHGMVVHPGSVLHGDENGLALVPEQSRERIPEMVERIRQRESELMAYVRSEEFTLDGLHNRIVE
jgi:4-hydroxy-4-methyl-2-oxoglutarate aldolase